MYKGSVLGSHRKAKDTLRERLCDEHEEIAIPSLPAGTVALSGLQVLADIQSGDIDCALVLYAKDGNMGSYAFRAGTLECRTFAQSYMRAMESLDLAQMIANAFIPPDDIQ